jgi:hypothetical protein
MFESLSRVRRQFVMDTIDQLINKRWLDWTLALLYKWAALLVQFSSRDIAAKATDRFMKDLFQSCWSVGWNGKFIFNISCSDVDVCPR